MWIAALTVALSLTLAQDPVSNISNPRQGDADAIRIGTALFQTRCADCHGIDAKGVVGPDLTALWASGANDGRLFQTIRRGVPGTNMPASNAPDGDIWTILAYLRSLETTSGATAASHSAATGNVANGERVFWASCGRCHQVNGRGGHLGPDLSRIGSARQRDMLTRDIRDASAVMRPGYRPVTLITTDGRRIRGTKKSEDAFSIQIMDTSEQLRGVVKTDVKEIVTDSRSLMPDFPATRLGDQDLEDLLAFLGSLRSQTIRP
jgi:putative heme-binding domain-containing protein